MTEEPETGSKRPIVEQLEELIQQMEEAPEQGEPSQMLEKILAALHDVPDELNIKFDDEPGGFNSLDGLGSTEEPKAKD
jgi:hypothetical protein